VTSSASVRLHRELYAEQAVADAAATFADFATFALLSEGDHLVVHATEITADVEGDVVAEFCNFALANSAVLRKDDDA
jgi:hypothetical protein